MTSIIDMAKSRAAPASASVIPSTQPTKDSAKDSAKVPAGAYKALELRQYIRNDGSVVSPVNGWFEPKDKEDEEMLEYYASKYNLVQAPAGK